MLRADYVPKIHNDIFLKCTSQAKYFNVMVHYETNEYKIISKYVI